MKTYYVTYRIDARYVTEVQANDVNEALKIATENYIDADFGEACDIDAEPVIVEDEDGNFVFEI